MYRINWTTPTGVSGHGEYCLDLETANYWLDKLTKDYPDMNHWLDSSESQTSQTTTCSGRDCCAHD